MKHISLMLLLPALLGGLARPASAQEDARQVYVCFYAAPMEKTINIMHDIYQGIAQSSDNGRSWRSIGYKTSLYNSISFDPERGDLYAASEYGVLRSTDGGATWKQLNGWDLQTIFRVVFLNGNIWLATPKGPAVSKDNGGTWTLLTKGLKPLNATYVSDMIAEGNDLTISTADGVYLSTNGGASWNPAGLQGQELDGIIRHPQSTAVLAVWQNGAGLWTSTDNGSSWQQANGDLHSKNIQTAAFDPRDPSVIYVGMSDYPVCKTTDGGKTWNTMNRGLMINNITAINVDPQQPDRVLAGTENGLWISTNGADDWQRSDIRFGYVSDIVFGEGAQ